MKVVAFNGSPRKDGNTAILLREVLTAIEAEGIETELVQLAGKTLRGCTACCGCVDNPKHRCVITNDCLNDCLTKMLEADGILLGSPTYFADVTAEMKALIDRAGYVARRNGSLLDRKVGAAVMAVRRAGSMHALDTMNHFFQINGMIIPGATYWNMGFGGGVGEVQNDDEGLANMKSLGQTMAWLLKKIHA